MIRKCLVGLSVFLIAACGGGGGGAPAPTPAPPAPPPSQSFPDLTQDKLLSDSEMVTQAILPEPAVSNETAQWIGNNHFPIRSITYDQDFSDLEFLASQIGDKKIVQIGESSHGSKEFNHVKVRLIKYLHQNLGFSVIAFESGFFEGLYVDQNRESLTADEQQLFIFGVWQTNEVFELFQYVSSTQSTSSPLRLAGFDIQISSPYYDRVGEFIEIIATDAEFNQTLKDDAARYILDYQNATTDYFNQICFNTVSSACDEIIERFRQAQIGLNNVLAQMESLTNPTQSQKELYIVVFAANGQIDNVLTRAAGGASSDLRDENMADVFDLVRRDIFPDEKIIIWAHNRHVANEQSETLPQPGGSLSPDTPMGFYLKNTYGDDLYTIGLYMLRGQSAANNRTASTVLHPRDNSLEAIAHSVRIAALYIDTRKEQSRVEGNEFLFEYTEVYNWGGLGGYYQMIPSDQFDGILIIDESSLPEYR